MGVPCAVSAIIPGGTHLCRPLLLALMLLRPGAPAVAQNAVSKAPGFDVVSIREAIDTNVRRLDWTPGRFVARSAPFVGLVNIAYGEGMPVRLEGGASFRLTMWDIEATFDPALNPGAEQRALMLRAVLEDRFRLVLRRESRETQVYALVLAHSNGRLGPSFQRSELLCDSPGRARFSTVPPAGQRPACGVLTNVPASAIIGGDTLIEPFTRTLGVRLQRPVIDRTGLAGKFDIVLTFALDSAVRTPVPANELPADPGNAPSIFTAVQEQLGLKLESTRAPLDYFIVERLEAPTPN